MIFMLKLQTKLSLKTLCLLTFMLLLSACKTPELDKNQQLIALIKAMETAIENKHVDDFMATLDTSITSDNGWGKKDIERLIRLRLMGRTSVHIHPQLKELNWQNEGSDEAQVVIVVAMAGTAFSLSDLARINADLIRFNVTFTRHDKDYLVSRVSWQPARPLDFL